MNKIGIVTYFKIYNYGSFLQAYSTVHTLRENGFGAELLDITYPKQSRYALKAKMLLKLVRYPRSMPLVKKLRVMGRGTISALDPAVKSAFDAAVQAHLPVRKISYPDLKRLAKTDEYTAFLAGSDQIWSPLGIDLKPHKFLLFAPPKKRLSYAPSFGVSYVPAYNRREICRNLRAMRALSVREESGKRLISELTGLTASVVLDPTLLMADDFWLSRTKEAPEPYILCYFLNPPAVDVQSAAVDFARRNGLELRYLPYANGFDGAENSLFCKADPFAFIDLVRNARLVLTDSFHGTAFSLIFETPFFVFPRYSEAAFKQSSRITDLLDKLGLSDHFVPPEKMQTLSLEQPLQTDAAKAKLEELRAESRKYLTETLQATEV